MLAIPMLFGLAAGGARSGAAWLVPEATVLVFLAHHAIVPWAQRTRERKISPRGYAARRLCWGSGYLAAAALAFSCAVMTATSAARGPFLSIAAAAAVLAAVYAIASVFGHTRSLAAEVLGLTGVSLTGPMMAAAAGRPLDRALFGVAALALGYFLSSVAFVRAYERLRAARRPAIRLCIIAHVALAGLLVAAAAYGALPAWWWIAFVPVVARTVWGLANPPDGLRQVGLREAWVAAAFTLLAGFALLQARFGIAQYQTGPTSASATAANTPGSPISWLRISRTTAPTMRRIGSAASTTNPGIGRGTRNGPRSSGSDRLSFKRAANSSANAAV